MFTSVQPLGGQILISPPLLVIRPSISPERSRSTWLRLEACGAQKTGRRSGSLASVSSRPKVFAAADCRTTLPTMHFEAEESKPVAPAASSRSPTFGTTLWTVVLAAGDPNHPDATAALDRLCRTYWYPVYAYVRRKGRTAADAEDLTQEFFSRLLARDFPVGVEREGGKFRSYLLRSLDHFLLNQWSRANAAKRGGGTATFSLDGVDADARYALEPRDESTPESAYDRRWASTVLETVRARLGEEYAVQGKAALFAALEPSLTGGDDLLPYSELMERLDLKASALKMAVHRLRKRFGELLREEIAQTVSTPAEIEDEIRELITAASA